MTNAFTVTAPALAYEKLMELPGIATQWIISRPVVNNKGETVNLEFSYIETTEKHSRGIICSVMDPLSTTKEFESRADAETFIKTWDANSRIDDLDNAGEKPNSDAAAGIIVLIGMGLL